MVKIFNKKSCFFFTHYLVIYSCRCARRCSVLNGLLRSYGFQQNKCFFEVETTPCRFELLKEKILDIINVKEDTVLIYPLTKQNVFSKEVFGKLKYRVMRIF